MPEFDIHKFIDECIEKKDRSVTIFFSNGSMSIGVYPLDEDEEDSNT